VPDEDFSLLTISVPDEDFSLLTISVPDEDFKLDLCGIFFSLEQC
jgi:hypothetical protein